MISPRVRVISRRVRVISPRVRVISPSALEAGHVGVDDEGENADRGGDDRVGDPLAPVLVRVRG